jgi:hypothetical protein
MFSTYFQTYASFYDHLCAQGPSQPSTTQVCPPKPSLFHIVHNWPPTRLNFLTHVPTLLINMLAPGICTTPSVGKSAGVVQTTHLEPPKPSLLNIVRNWPPIRLNLLTHVPTLLINMLAPGICTTPSVEKSARVVQTTHLGPPKPSLFHIVRNWPPTRLNFLTNVPTLLINMLAPGICPTPSVGKSASVVQTTHLGPQNGLFHIVRNWGPTRLNFLTHVPTLLINILASGICTTPSVGKSARVVPTNTAPHWCNIPLEERGDEIGIFFPYFLVSKMRKCGIFI